MLHVRIQFKLLQRNRQQHVLVLETIFVVMPVPLYAIGSEGGYVLTLISHGGLGITPAHEILITYALVAKFQTLLGLDVTKCYG